MLVMLLCACTVTPQTTPEQSEAATGQPTATQSALITNPPQETPTNRITPEITPEDTDEQPTAEVTPQQTATPEVTPGTVTPSAVVTQKPTAAPTDKPTVKPTSTVVTADPTVSHQVVSKWDYYFTYGDALMKATALTRFNDGTKGGTSGNGYGSFTTSDDGMLIKAGTSGCFDSYNAYSGANIMNADYTDAKYVGITLENKESHDVWLCLQGFHADNRMFIIYPEGDPIALATQDGKLYVAEGKDNVTFRHCISIPANFKGSVIIPANRLATSCNPSDNPTKWDSHKSPLQRIGFNLTDNGTQGLLIKAMFICSTELDAPNKVAGGIENENYSYTTAQRIAPFWKSSTMYNESLAMIKQANGDIYGTLLFTPTKINAVVDVYLKKEYKEGVDWEWVQGTNKIKWLNGSSIPYFTDSQLSGKNEEGQYVTPVDFGGKYQGQTVYWDSQGRGRFGNCLYCVSAFLYERQICVSYTYDTNQIQSLGIQYTSYQGDRLPKTVSKLKNNRDLKVLFYGDSIFEGCDASSRYSRAPYMPEMHTLIKDRLQQETTGKVTLDNIAVGGWTAQDGLNALSGTVGSKNYSGSYQGYDLLILSFGGNNGSTSRTEFVSTTKKTIDKIKQANPDMEVILVSCMRMNPRAQGFDGNQKYHGQWLSEDIANNASYSSYTAFVDFGGVHGSILTQKNYASTTGNNINHPNDWLIRVYAQNILATLIQ